MRTLTLMSKVFTEPINVAFDPDYFSDSEALHQVLIQYDPGDIYIVEFHNDSNAYSDGEV